MKFLPLALLLTLLLSPSVASAEWKHMKGNHYIDLDDTVVGYSVFIWFLNNSRNVWGQSVSKRREYDCILMRDRVVAITGWSGAMGTGTPKRFSPSMEWQHLNPGSFHYKLGKSICSRAGL